MIKEFTPQPKIAYFTMEIGLIEEIPTYCGGLGILSGDILRSAADLNLPLIGVTLLARKGYFRQKLTKKGKQIEYPVDWNPKKYLKLLPTRAEVKIRGRQVIIQPWLFTLSGLGDGKIYVLFLDTDLKENSPKDRKITYFLYGGDARYRLKQEIVLGIGGVRILKRLGINVKKYHINEGHAAFLTLELLKMNNFDLKKTRRMCLFTNHTPVASGHDRFDYKLVKQEMEQIIPISLLRKLGGLKFLNMTKLALNMSGYINAVSKRHRQILEKMFPGYKINAITNGVHSYRWTHPAFRKLYDKYIPGWSLKPELFLKVSTIPNQEIWQARKKAKREMINYINELTRVGMKENILTIGFARRVADYKRHNFIFSDLKRLRKISKKYPFQIIFSGKAHPQDKSGKKIIKKVFQNIKKLRNDIKIVYLSNYDIGMAKKLTAGCDVWLNTPLPSLEASGTSGMKAAHNGGINFSILDGWWPEGCIEGINGWSIGPHPDEKISRKKRSQKELDDFYTKLENVILPIYYNQQDKWIEIVKNSISKIAYYFNTNRMITQYFLHAYR